MSARCEDFQNVSVECGGMRIDMLMDHVRDCFTHIRSSSYRMHDHAVHELYLIEQGEMTIECDGRMVELHPGDMCVIRAGVSHRVVRCSEPFLRFNLRFLLHNAGALEEMLPPLVILNPDKTRLDELLYAAGGMRRMMQQALSETGQCRIRAYGMLLFAGLLDLLLPTEGNPASDDAGRITMYVRIDNFLFDHCAEPITAEDLADYLNYSRTQTNRILKDCFGKSFKQKLTELRMRAARQYLTETDLPVEELAIRCGYNTRQGFETVFKKYHGMTPRLWREKHEQRVE
ncbi:MAG: helix-turn-helix transcriptional regulator [Clostridia bacterium]|nr:helix-turn-helix transcriptional regulator [Clostridia bacterium]